MSTQTTKYQFQLADGTDTFDNDKFLKGNFQKVEDNTYSKKEVDDKLGTKQDATALSNMGLTGQSKPFTGDLNTIASGGFYTCVNATNAPVVNEYFFIIHNAWDANSQLQIAVQLSSGRLWTRTKNVNSWGAWNEK
jgi:hypothetical protein